MKTAQNSTTTDRDDVQTRVRASVAALNAADMDVSSCACTVVQGKRLASRRRLPAIQERNEALHDATLARTEGSAMQSRAHGQ
jgi:hypothetical protein